MSNRRKRTLRDLCDATPTLSQPEIYPLLRGNDRMQGPTDEANRNMLTHMVTSEDNKGCSSFSDRSQKLYCKGKSGTCNVCSTPCSSCFHANKVLIESNDESAGETCAGDTETGQLSVLSTVGGMDSTADSRTENAAGKASSKTSNASVSDDSVVHSKSEGRRSTEGHDDCLSCVSGTEEHANRIFDTEDSGIKYKKLSICGDNSDKVSPASSQTRIHTPNSGVGCHSSTKVTDDATDLLKDQTTPQAPSGKNLSHDKKLGDIKDDKHSDTKEEPLKGSTEHLNSLSPSGAASDVCGDHPATALGSTEKNDNMEVEILPTDETDDSDMVEQDVKVCDICGDAGREDLLAVCCRCSDGAEHTYCMREMQLKVPEGDWFCEDCKTVLEVEKARQEKKGRRDKNEKNSSSGQASENLNSSDVEDRRMKGLARIPSKRFRDDDDTEVSSVAKKPALESIVGSPKTSNSSRTALLSRDSSFKNLDRSKLNSPHVSSPETVPVNDNTESAKSASDLRLHDIRGNFSKSNSFNSLNSKPKVKLVDKFIQRQKSDKEHSSFRLKDGAVRSIGKSMSFKSTNCSRSESKTKMLSPRPSHIQDTKNTKEKSTFERQRSFKTEHPSSNSMMGTSMSSRIDKRSASRVEPSSPTAVGSYHEVKPMQADSKTAALSRSSSLAPRRTADLSSSTGQFKRPSTHGHSTLGVSSANGVNNTEQKNNQTTLNQESFPEKSALNANELPGGLPRPKDLTDSGDRMREYSGSRYGPSSVKSSRDESDNLKAALEAAALRKPGVYRKLRAPGQSDEPSIPTMGCEAASHQDHMSTARKKKMCSDAELLGRPSVRNFDSLKEETLNNEKQSSMAIMEGLSAGGQGGAPIGPSSGDVFRNMSAVMPLLLKSLAIPEHEYIWQGSFEICRGGQMFDSWDGIQAHLSTCASPKVTEAVKKFKSRIVFYEVPRLSTWPIQFQENGVREDNIGLFFFAKDLDSYIKIYKVLLDKMMRNDLALKGNIDGVELLIFPSNQLPDNLQRWNMLYYLWGVFRAKKESCLQQMPESINQYCAPQNIPAPIMSLPENRCSLRPIAENAKEDADPVLAVPVSEDLGNLLTAGVSRGSGAEGSSLDQLDHGLSSSSSHVVPSDGAKECQEIKGTNQEGGIGSIGVTPLAMRSPTSGRDQIQTQLDTSLSRQQLPHYPIKYVPKEGLGKGTTSDKICHQNEVENQVNARDLNTSGEIPLEDSLSTRDLNVTNSRWPFGHKESTHTVLPQPFYAGPSQFSAEPRNDNIHPEKMNHVPSVPAFLEPERRFFPVESAPVHDGWKMHFGEDRLRAPNLELALGAETTPPLTLGIEPLLINKVDEKVNEPPVLEEVTPKAEDDVSASLSLSLSFPFPENELNSKPAPKAEQLVAQRKSVNNSSMLLFGKLRDD